MFLSFIVPIYNTEKYITECLNSLLTQDILINDYEIICINDGSKDNSLEILKSFQKKYSNIKIIDIANGGVSNARNIGLENATGEYVWMVDSDDFIAYNILSKIKNIVMEKNIDILDFGAYAFTEQLNDQEIDLFSQNKLKPNSFANNVFVTRSVFKRSVINDNNIRFDIDIAYSEDSLFKIECLLKNPTVDLIMETYYFFRNRIGSATTLKTDDFLNKKFSSYVSATVKFKEYYQICEQSLKSQLSDLMMSNLWSALFVLAEMPFKKILTELKMMKDKGIYPIIRPQECSINRSCLTTRSDIFAKIFDKIFINTHHYFGFIVMCIWCKLYALYKR